METETLSPPERLALAALLHDIGKFAQRGIADRAQPPHAEAGADFVREFVPEQFRRQGLHPVLQHHAPPDEMDPATRVVALADRLAAGERTPYAERGTQGRVAQMQSVFSRVSLGDGPKREAMYLPLAATQVAQWEDVIPQAGPLDEAALKGKYAALWQAFCREAAQLRDEAKRHGQIAPYLEGLYHLMARYTATIPAAFFYDEPDVSLFDHSRVTAAVVCCVRELDEQRVSGLLARSVPAEDTAVALLVGGDISGVQDFVYTITSAHAARTLRGRSLYLQLLTEAVMRYVLRRLELPITSVIYSGGGHFYLLAPPTAAAALEAVRAEVTKKLLDHHGVDLYLALGWTTMTAADFTAARMQVCWDATHRELRRIKRSRYRELEDRALVERVFTPRDSGDGEATCSVCHREWHVRAEMRKEDDDTRTCPLCWSFYALLGRQLPKATHLVLGVGAPDADAKRGDCLQSLRTFGLRIALVGEREQPPTSRFDDAEYAVVLTLRDGVGAGPDLNLQTVRGTRYTVNLIPTDKDGAPITFDKLEERTKGINRLGVLRMDVDNLGQIFSQGLRGRATLSRIAGLSRVVSLFFEGRVAVICREVGEGLVYAVYAGGDDLFLIGPWHLMPALARRIHDELDQLTGKHPDVHVSAGIALIGGKYPVYQAAQDAGEALERAKGVDGKDAISFLGETLRWADFSEVESTFKALHELHRHRAPKGLLNRLRSLEALRRQTQDQRAKAGRQVDNAGPWVWRGSYSLVRMAQENKDREEVNRGIARLLDQLTKARFANLPRVALAARWAQLYLRRAGER